MMIRDDRAERSRSKAKCALEQYKLVRRYLPQYGTYGTHTTCKQHGTGLCCICGV